MDTNEKLALTKRVDRASEDEVRTAMRYMIMQCNTQRTGIARAIRDAVERHTPTPTVVYEKSETGDDEEAGLVPSHKKSAKKRKKHRPSDSDDDGVPVATSQEHRSTGLRQKRSKSEIRGQTKESSDHDAQRSRLHSKKRREENKKIKHAIKQQIEQNKSDVSTGRSSKQRKRTTIDLVSSSDVEAVEKEQPSKFNLDSSVSDGDLDLAISSEEELSYTAAEKKHTPSSRIPEFDFDSSDNDTSTGELLNSAFGGGQPSQNGFRAKSAQSAVRNGGGGGRAQSVTVSAAKASTHHNDANTGSLGLEKKRKAFDLPVEDVQTKQPAKSVPVIHPSKRPKQISSEETQESPGGPSRKCAKCEKTFLIFELRKHLRSCTGTTATVDRVSEAPAKDQPNQPKPSQKAGDPAGDVVPAEPQNTVQLPSRPIQTVPSDRELSKPPPSLVHQPSSLARGPTGMPLPMTVGRSVAGTQSLPSNCFRPPNPVFSSSVSSRHELRPPRPDPPRQRLMPEVEGQDARRCTYCTKWFGYYEDSENVCECHPGIYRRLTDVNMDQYRVKFGMDPVPPYLAWSCCLRQGKYARPCRLGRHVSFVPHAK